jgi:hypothetical protein
MVLERLGRLAVLTMCLAVVSGVALGQPAFLSVSRDGTYPDVLEAIEAGVSVNFVDEYGQTALMYAASVNSDPEVFTLLVTSGANINAKSAAGWTALMYAARSNPNTAVVARLLELGADPKIRNGEGTLAVDLAASNSAFTGTSVLLYLEALSAAPPPAPTANPQPGPEPAPTPVRSCCKICRKGKACGNSCISRSYTCHKGPGCACNADLGTDDFITAEEWLLGPPAWLAGDIEPDLQGCAPNIEYFAAIW